MGTWRNIQFDDLTLKNSYKVKAFDLNRRGDQVFIGQLIEIEALGRGKGAALVLFSGKAQQSTTIWFGHVKWIAERVESKT